MENPFDQYILNKKEPVRGCLLALKKIILSLDENISTAWKYGMPFFCYRNKMFCYLWLDKKTKQPYLGLVEGNRMDHPLLEKGDRSRMKILRLEADKDLPVELIKQLIIEALDFYRKGIIKIK